MEREHDDSGLIELGTASTDTLGQPILNAPEPKGYQPFGLLHD